MTVWCWERCAVPVVSCGVSVPFLVTRGSHGGRGGDTWANEVCPWSIGRLAAPVCASVSPPPPHTVHHHSHCVLDTLTTSHSPFVRQQDLCSVATRICCGIGFVRTCVSILSTLDTLMASGTSMAGLVTNVWGMLTIQGEG